MARLKCIALIFAMSVLMCVLAEELYSDRYDYIDISTVLQDENEREAYYNCYMKTVPCQTPAQAALTAMFSEAYFTECKKCTEKQKIIFKRVIEWYMKNDPEKWQLIIAKAVKDMKKKYADQ